MSQTQTNTIPTFSPANPNDIDTYGEDCTREMTARSTTITSVAAPSIVSVPASATALVVSGVVVLSGGLQYAFQAEGGAAGAYYIITFPLTLADGNLLNRTVIIPVAQYVG